MHHNIWYVSKYLVFPSEGQMAGHCSFLMEELSQLSYNIFIIISDSNHFLAIPSLCYE